MYILCTIYIHVCVRMCLPDTLAPEPEVNKLIRKVMRKRSLKPEKHVTCWPEHQRNTSNAALSWTLWTLILGQFMKLVKMSGSMQGTHTVQSCIMSLYEQLACATTISIPTPRMEWSLAFKTLWKFLQLLHPWPSTWRRVFLLLWDLCRGSVDLTQLGWVKSVKSFDKFDIDSARSITGAANKLPFEPPKKSCRFAVWMVPTYRTDIPQSCSG